MTIESETAMSSLLGFLSDLEGWGISYRLSAVRRDAVMVELSIPGYHWEVEFFSDGTVETERFDSQGVDTTAPTLGHLRQELSKINET